MAKKDNYGYIKETCFLCGQQFSFGPHRYDGKLLQRYDRVMVCKGCYEANWDGFTGRFAQKLEKHLAEKGLPIPGRNASGYLPRD